MRAAEHEAAEHEAAECPKAHKIKRKEIVSRAAAQYQENCRNVWVAAMHSAGPKKACRAKVIDWSSAK